MTAGVSGMILPPVDPVTGELDADYSDVRVPGPAAFRAPRATPVGRLYRWGQPETECIRQGRHLFDALMSREEERWVEDPKEGMRELPPRFALRLTCVRCGEITRLEGELNEKLCDYTQVELEQLRAGGLVAQRIDSFGRSFRREPMATYTIYRGESRVGVIGWQMGPRGGVSYVGYLGAVKGRTDSSPQAEGKTPLAVLRKLAKAPTRVNDEEEDHP